MFRHEFYARVFISALVGALAVDGPAGWVLAGIAFWAYRELRREWGE